MTPSKQQFKVFEKRLVDCLLEEFNELSISISL